MAYKNFLYTKENGIGVMTMNRPEVLNAFSYDSLGETSDALDEIAADSEVKVFVIREPIKSLPPGRIFVI